MLKSVPTRHTLPSESHPSTSNFSGVPPDPKRDVTGGGRLGVTEPTFRSSHLGGVPGSLRPLSRYRVTTEETSVVLWVNRGRTYRGPCPSSTEGDGGFHRGREGRLGGRCTRNGTEVIRLFLRPSLTRPRRVPGFRTHTLNRGSQD